MQERRGPAYGVYKAERAPEYGVCIGAGQVVSIHPVDLLLGGGGATGSGEGESSSGGLASIQQG